VSFTFGTFVQVTILTVGIYLLLSFLRTTRGLGLVRGLIFALIVGVIGLSLLAEVFKLEELRHLIGVITGYVAVLLAILFQPELRRGLVHLGENPWVGRLLFQPRQREALTEVSHACVSMAKKRQGALIAFERRIALDAYTERGVPMDAEVNRLVLDSIFLHGGPLHDGAVVVRGDRLQAAACLFPLSDNAGLSQSTGTRHRAAIGITEETDAVAIAVSEETGAISICKGGEIQRYVSPARVEAVLREKLGDGERGSPTRRPTLEVVQSLLLHNLSLKVGALTIALGLFWIAHQRLLTERQFPLQVRVEESGAARRSVQNELLLRSPGTGLHLSLGDEDVGREILVRGTHAELERLAPVLVGELQLPQDVQTGTFALSLEDVRWHSNSGLTGLDLTWVGGDEPAVEVERFGVKSLVLGAEHVAVVLDGFSPRYKADVNTIVFRPNSVTVEGPVGMIETLDDTTPLRLEDLVLTADVTSDLVQDVGLHQDLIAAGFRFAGQTETVQLQLTVRETDFDLGVIQTEIALVNTAADAPHLVEQWQLPEPRATFTIHARGILPDLDQTSEAYRQKETQVRTWVKENLRVFVDVSRIPPGGTSGEIESLLRDSWRQELPEEFGVTDPRAELWVVRDSPATILLKKGQE